MTFCQEAKVLLGVTTADLQSLTKNACLSKIVEFISALLVIPFKSCCQRPLIYQGGLPLPTLAQ